MKVILNSSHSPAKLGTSVLINVPEVGKKGQTHVLRCALSPKIRILVIQTGILEDLQKIFIQYIIWIEGILPVDNSLRIVTTKQYEEAGHNITKCKCNTDFEKDDV